MFIPGVNLLYLIAEIIKWIVLLFIILKGKSSRRSITNCTYDIEVNTKNYKVIRNKDGKIGLCYWEDWYHNSLLIKPIYTAIERVDDISYILKTNGRYGLYNGNRKKIILACKYDMITNVHDDVYEVIINREKAKYNIEGDRILY